MLNALVNYTDIRDAYILAHTKVEALPLNLVEISSQF